MAWNLVVTTPFKRSYKKLAGLMRERTRIAIKEICNSSNPKELGRLKKGHLDGCYGYDLSSDCRILYSVDEDKRRVIFHRVCSHSEVYR